MSFSILPRIDLSMTPVAEPPLEYMSHFNNHEYLASTIISITTITSGLAFLMLTARLYSTFRITRSSGLDDYTCILAFLFSMANTGLVIHSRHYARHIWDIPLDDFNISTNYVKIVLTEIIVGALGWFFSKLSVLLLLFRLFSPNRLTRYLLFLGIAWALTISLITLALAGAMCAPRRGESFDDLTLSSRCSHQTAWAVIHSVLVLILDFYILYVPIPRIWRLQLSIQRKFGVLSIFMTGIVYDFPVACLVENSLI